MIHHVQPVEVLPLFPVLDELLMEVLTPLTEEDWNLPTAAGAWTVKDVAAHLLDGNLRSISITRDNYLGEKPDSINTYLDLVSYLHELNNEWVNAMKRLSPQLILEMLRFGGAHYYESVRRLDPWEDAVFSESWAGEEISKNWFYLAREYTDKWIHQQFIREAVGKPGLMTRELFQPFLNTFMCALPHTYRYADAVTGTSVMVRVTTELGGEWHINKTEEGWVLRHSTRIMPNSIVEMVPDTAWRLFSKRMTPEQALEKVKIEGAAELGKIALGIVSVVA